MSELEFKLGKWVIELRPVNIDDHFKAKEYFGKNIGAVLKEASENNNLKDAMILIYNQIVPSQTSYFKPETYTAYDLDGNKKKIKIGGYRKMMRYFDTDSLTECLQIYTKALKLGVNLN
ncbi:hypothetical protein KAR91_40800 [Candidatus Pacearchaeota archaeon]|nr:hypothetical protein [Candidatus Pacearchaeota archaeon]